MGRYRAPDVYVEEVPSGARPIEAVGASTAAFVGVAPDAEAHVNEPQAINNPTQFQKEFYPKDKNGNVLELSVVKDEKGQPVKDADGGLQRRFFEMENGEPTGNGIPLSDEALYLSQAVHGFFLNGGSRCYVVNIGASGRIKEGLDQLARIDEVAIVAAPGRLDAHDDLLTHCEELRDRVAILDGPESVEDLEQLTRVAGGSKGKGKEPAGLHPRLSRQGYGAFYFPWLVVRDPASTSASDTVKVPPSGHMAGIWARSEATRGVHKAPANEPVRGALELSYYLTRAEQEVLNPAGVNCLRWFSQEGILVWGARTVAPGASEWRYLNVRRLFNVIEESIARSTRWIVFEPNDYTLWKSIRRDISAFLTGLWRAGALMGKTPAEAFFVKCDEETNPQDSIDLGQVVAIIGIAPVKPAEFVIFRLMQTPTGAKTEVQGG